MKLSDVDSIELEDVMLHEAEKTDSYLILVNDTKVLVKELGITMQAGVYCEWDIDKETYDPDFAVTVIYEEGKEGFYFEQDPMLTALHNYCHITSKKLDKDVSELECEVLWADREVQNG